uniref:Uncharacterized protein n=2 Tax=Anguilla anguilla TaxID=7936 RepID=A0A0E9UMN9_ANGAN
MFVPGIMFVHDFSTVRNTHSSPASNRVPQSCYKHLTFRI